MRWIELARWERAAPTFHLPTVDGDTVTRAQFRHRKHLVLIFLPRGDSSNLVEPFAARMPDFEQASAVVYAVAPEGSPLVTRLPVLLDPKAEVRRSYADRLPAEARPASDQPLIAVIDRYGVLSYLGVTLADDASAVDEALSHVWGIEYECPE